MGFLSQYASDRMKRIASNKAQEKGEKPSSNFIQTNIYISIKEGRQDEDAGVNIPRFFWGTRASPLSFFFARQW